MIESMLIPSRFHKVVHLDWLRPPEEVLIVILYTPIIKHRLVEYESKEGFGEIVY
jgi:hypothetical protein